METDPEIYGVPMSKWPTDELLYLPWSMVLHLTDEERQRILKRAKAEGLTRPTRKES